MHDSYEDTLVDGNG